MSVPRGRKRYLRSTKEQVTLPATPASAARRIWGSGGGILLTTPTPLGLGHAGAGLIAEAVHGSTVVCKLTAAAPTQTVEPLAS